MPSDERLLAWIEPHGGDCLVSFVAEPEAKRRAPAMRQCASQDEARQWVMREADAVRAPVEWIAKDSVRDRVQH